MSTQDGKYWDVSFNPWIGCSRISEACKHCWAGALRNRFAAGNGWPDFFAGPVYQPNATGNVVMLTWRDGAGQQKGEYVRAEDVVSVRRFRE